MALPEALALLREHVASTEPPIPCPTCHAIFPRPDPALIKGQEWKPGLRFAPEWVQWWDAVHEWEKTDKKAPPPSKPEVPFYAQCVDCAGAGVKEPGSGPWHDCLKEIEAAIAPSG